MIDITNIIYYDPKLWKEDYFISRYENEINLIHIPTDTVIATYKSDDDIKFAKLHY
jgi:phosphosulfolactate synthase (CoM biosynthesis protein A)